MPVTLPRISSVFCILATIGGGSSIEKGCRRACLEAEKLIVPTLIKFLEAAPAAHVQSEDAFEWAVRLTRIREQRLKPGPDSQGAAAFSRTGVSPNYGQPVLSRVD